MDRCCAQTLQYGLSLADGPRFCVRHKPPGAVRTDLVLASQLTPQLLQRYRVIFCDDNVLHLRHHCECGIMNVRAPLGPVHGELGLPYEPRHLALFAHPAFRTVATAPLLKYVMRSQTGLTLETLQLLLASASAGRTIVLDWDCTITGWEALPDCFLALHDALPEEDRETLLLEPALGSRARRAVLFELLRQKSVLILTAQLNGSWITRLLAFLGVTGVKVVGEEERQGQAKTSYIKEHFCLCHI